jgi:hypothetical protein
MGRPDPTTGDSAASLVVENLLAHHGIKGMHWGVRKGKSAESKPEASDDAKVAKAAKDTIKSGGTKALSTKELQSLVKRMNLEQQYRDLKGKEPNQFDKGQKIVKDVLSVAKTGQEIYGLVNSPAGRALRGLLENR